MVYTENKQVDQWSSGSAMLTITRSLVEGIKGRTGREESLKKSGNRSETGEISNSGDKVEGED
ncbi:hypothetical protein G5I_06146 [Acromyrmex echinatior]|uniref:Uncharacterized protein n=1 Tax=Acromyrmex echinatior TaxID=103372 RepID=F4WK94_ACREC|nr:hypothetical protein G5I_06146 [Acromyrmex echinatior]